MPSTKAASRPFITLIALGFIARIVLMLTSSGTIDAEVWRGYGRSIRAVGIAELSRSDPSFNHPPLPAYYAAFSDWLAERSAIPFSTLFKLPLVLADFVSCWLIFRAVRDRRDGRRATIAAALYAWCPSAIVVSAYHCNTEALYAMLSLLAAWRLGAPLSAGLALGAAINIKLIPATLIIPLLLSCRDRRSATRFVTGLAISAMPFVLLAITLRGTFIRNTLSYSPPVDAWGFMFFLTCLARVPAWSVALAPVIARYAGLTGRALIFATIALASLHARRRRMDPIAACAIGAAIYLSLTPGFGIHHALFALPLMFAARPKFAAVSGILIGAMQIITYANSITWTMPLGSGGPIHLHGAGMWVGLLAWASLALFVVTSFWKNRGIAASNRLN